MERIIKESDVLALIDAKIERLEEDFEMFGDALHAVTPKLSVLRALRQQIAYLDGPKVPAKDLSVLGFMVRTDNKS